MTSDKRKLTLTSQPRRASPENSDGHGRSTGAGATRDVRVVDIRFRESSWPETPRGICRRRSERAPRESSGRSVLWKCGAACDEGLQPAHSVDLLGASGALSPLIFQSCGYVAIQSADTHSLVQLFGRPALTIAVFMPASYVAGRFGYLSIPGAIFVYGVCNHSCKTLLLISSGHGSLLPAPCGSGIPAPRLGLPCVPHSR